MEGKSEEFGELDAYRGKIIEMINSVNDLEFITFVFKFVNRLKENWGV